MLPGEAILKKVSETIQVELLSPKAKLSSYRFPASRTKRESEESICIPQGPQSLTKVKDSCETPIAKSLSKLLKMVADALTGALLFYRKILEKTNKTRLVAKNLKKKERIIFEIGS